MQKLLFLVYVLVVATLSISARAESNVPLLVNSIQHDRDAHIFQVNGQYPNPCIETAIPELAFDQKGKLVLDIVGKTSAEICISIVGPSFMLAVDLNNLKSDLSELNLDENGTHQIFDRDGRLISEVDFSKVYFAIPFNKTNVEGVLSYDENGYYVDGPMGVRTEIQSRLSQLDNLVGAHVVLTGHMMMHSVSQPVFRSNVTARKFIATGVSFSVTD